MTGIYDVLIFDWVNSGVYCRLYGLTYTADETIKKRQICLKHDYSGYLRPCRIEGKQTLTYGIVENRQHNKCIRKE